MNLSLFNALRIVKMKFNIVVMAKSPSEIVIAHIYYHYLLWLDRESSVWIDLQAQ
jgi:hypothetical protein